MVRYDRLIPFPKMDALDSQRVVNSFKALVLHGRVGITMRQQISLKLLYCERSTCERSTDEPTSTEPP